jgi:glutathione S-transferase
MYLGDYGLVGSEMSMFTRKLEAQLRFQQIPWYWSFKTQARTAEVEARTGTHFIPALITPDKWMIHDTIAIGPFLHDRFRHAPVIPDTPLQRACCFILEDVFNHWLGPICVHTRWCYPDNVAWVGPRFGANTVLDRSIDEPFTEQELRDLTPIGDMMYESFGRNVCDVNGVGPEQQPAVQAAFTRLLQVLDEHFANNDFLLGPRPCLADFALAGACKAHFVTDPVPLGWLGLHRDMLFAYTDRLFGTHAFGDRHWLEDDAVPVSLQGLLTYAQETYFQSARANIAAGLRGEKFFEYNAGFGVIRARTQKRLNLARLHVRNELQRDGACDSIAVGRLFEGRGILDHYLH